MDTQIKNIDEIGEETEGYISLAHGHVVCKPIGFTPSTSSFNYIIKSDNQVKRGHHHIINIPSRPPSIPSDETVRGFWPGITKRGRKHHRFSYLSLLLPPSRKILLFFVRCFQFCPSPHLTPYNQKLLQKRYSNTKKEYTKLLQNFTISYLNLTIM